MKIPIFPGKYHQNGGFSMAMLPPLIYYMRCLGWLSQADSLAGFSGGPMEFLVSAFFPTSHWVANLCVFTVLIPLKDPPF